ncbi:hypothetical protein BH10PSE17_BH10PSE17_35890 [soil metagenome]
MSSSNPTTAFDVVAPHNRSLQLFERELHRLELRWDTIEATTRMVCPAQAAGFLPTLARTRADFATLQASLLERLAAARLDNLAAGLGSRAQLAIDVLNRNLFERTADVGFIATDAVLVEFVTAPDADASETLRARLRDYRSKYTVYADIVVLDREGTVVCRLADESHGACHARSSPWLAEALCRDGHVEWFGPCSLFENPAALIYAHRIADAAGQVAGCIVLRFDLQSELQALYADIGDDDDRSCIAFIDADAVVFATNRPRTAGVGEHLQPGLDPIMVHHDDEHLVQVRETRGYQGYRGLPWRAVALCRIDLALRERAAASDDDDESAIDDPDLRTIIDKAATIHRALARLVWNGKLADAGSTGAASLQAILDQIGLAGQRTTEAFERGIDALRRLTLARERARLESQARLAVTIMDRNLYERANDCRWWAQSAALQRALGKDGASPSGATEVLDHLNELYTVYRRIALLDAGGRAVATSRQVDTLLGIEAIDAPLRNRLGSLDAQGYAVTPFARTALCDDEATWLYCAPVRTHGRISGSVALAFDATREFAAMLDDTLDAGFDGFAVYLDEDDTIVSSTDPAWTVGSTLPVDLDHAGLEPGATAHRTAVIGAERYRVGLAVSHGYREFKRSDGYRQRVVAAVFQRTAPVARRQAPLPARSDSTAVAAGRRVGIVLCGDLVIAVPTEHIVEAVTVPRLVRLPSKGVAGIFDYTGSGHRCVVPVVSPLALDAKDVGTIDDCLVLVLRSGSRLVGVRIDALDTVTTLVDSAVKPAPVTARLCPWLTGFVEVDGRLAALADVDRLAPPPALPADELLRQLASA